jgi:Flp pilus assembly pilin Flp
MMQTIARQCSGLAAMFPHANLHNLWIDESAQDLVEYALIACIIALGAFSSVKGLTNKLVNILNSEASTMNALP